MSKDLKRDIEYIMPDFELSRCVVDRIQEDVRRGMETNNHSMVGKNILSAYQKHDCDALLVALTGRTMEEIVDWLLDVCCTNRPGEEWNEQMNSSYTENQLESIKPGEPNYLEAQYILENGCSLIDFDWWVHLEEIVGRQLPYSDYQKVDRVYDGDIMELVKADAMWIDLLLSPGEKKHYRIECAGVIELDASDEEDAEIIASNVLTVDHIGAYTAREVEE